ncbi:MAG TPA: hypothetical protein VFT42_01170 [Solirubrobacteraceae bacterium]|nr:hypothetical protein [Solirubrobacteraceae bacterium]
MMVKAYCALLRLRSRLGECAGQGTVEYVALMLLVAGILGAVVVAGHGLDGKAIASTVSGKIKDAIDGVAQAKK